MKIIDLKQIMVLVSRYRLLNALRLFSRSPALMALSIYMTDRCNMNCHMCQSRGGLKNEELDTDLLKKVIDEVSGFRIRPRIHLSGGGEPTIHKGFIDIIRYCRGKKLIWSVTTNGFTMEKIYKDIVDNNCDHITFSIHGTRPAHEKTVGVPGSFDKAVSGIRLLDRYKKEKGAARPPIALNCVLNRNNIGDLREILRFYNTLPVNSVTFQHMIFNREDMHSAESSILKDTGDIDKIKEFVRYVRSGDPGIKVVFLPDLKEKDIVPYYTDYDHPFGRTCVQPWLVMRINPDGEVPTCGNTAKLGNIRDTSVKELWNSPGNRAFRRHMREAASSKTGMPAKCYRCCVRQY